MAERRLQIFSKAPESTTVKTRLAAALTLNQRQSLQHNLLTHCLETCSHVTAERQLWAYPKIDETVASLAKNADATAHLQKGEDLGERMLNALNSETGKRLTTVLIGTDCPDIDHSYLQLAYTKLDQSPENVVLGPAEDGGFVLIATYGPLPVAAFDGVAWGSSQVLDQVCENLRALGKTVRELPKRHDIDRPEDLVHLPEYLDPRQ